MYLYIGGLVAKKIELLREMAPDLGNFAVAVNAGTPSAKLDSAEADGARASGKPVSIVNVGNDAEIDAMFANLGGHMAGVVIGTDTFFFAKRVHLAAAAARPACPPVLVHANSSLQAVSRFELVINTSAAKALDLKIPQTLLATAAPSGNVGVESAIRALAEVRRIAVEVWP
jgi:ABC-type uncharacterized transport system substrate-binding protein